MYNNINSFRKLFPMSAESTASRDDTCCSSMGTIAEIPSSAFLRHPSAMGGHGLQLDYSGIPAATLTSSAEQIAARIFVPDSQASSLASPDANSQVFAIAHHVAAGAYSQMRSLDEVVFTQKPPNLGDSLSSDVDGEVVHSQESLFDSTAAVTAGEDVPFDDPTISNSPAIPIFTKLTVTCESFNLLSSPLEQAGSREANNAPATQSGISRQPTADRTFLDLNRETLMTELRSLVQLQAESPVDCDLQACRLRSDRFFGTTNQREKEQVSLFKVPAPVTRKTLSSTIQETPRLIKANKSECQPGRTITICETPTLLQEHMVFPCKTPVMPPVELADTVTPKLLSTSVCTLEDEILAPKLAWNNLNTVISSPTETGPKSGSDVERDLLKSHALPDADGPVGSVERSDGDVLNLFSEVPSPTVIASSQVEELSDVEQLDIFAKSAEFGEFDNIDIFAKPDHFGKPTMKSAVRRRHAKTTPRKTVRQKTTNSSRTKKVCKSVEPPISQKANLMVIDLERGAPVWAKWALDGYFYPATTCEAASSRKPFLSLSVKFTDGSKHRISKSDNFFPLDGSVATTTLGLEAKPDYRLSAIVDRQSETDKSRSSKKRARSDEMYYSVRVLQVYARDTFLVEGQQAESPFSGMAWLVAWDDMRLKRL